MSYTNRTMPRLLMKVWDAPTRLFHWAIVLLIPISYVTQAYDLIAWHYVAGYALLALLLFRLVWGFVGSDTSRFGRFLRNPVEGLRHLAQFGRREPDVEIGHNAAGGWMVLALLALLFAQVATGLFGYGDVDAYGPLSAYLTRQQAEWSITIHAVLFNVILAAIGLHVATIIAYYAVKRQNLVWPMITGRKRLPGNLRQPRMASPLLAMLIAAVAGGAVWLMVAITAS